jgi:hypothetical protein
LAGDVLAGDVLAGDVLSQNVAMFRRRCFGGDVPAAMFCPVSARSMSQKIDNKI